MKNVIIICLLTVCSVTLATDLPFDVPDLPKMRGSVIHVRTEPQLQNAVSQMRDNLIILIHPGIYKLTNSLNIHKPAKNMKILGATGNPADVILVGEGMTAESKNVPHGIIAGYHTENLLIAHLTVKEFFYHSIAIMSTAKAPRIYNCRLIDAGQQFIKGNTEREKGVNGGIVEYNVIEYTKSCKGGYTNGLSIHHADGWQIRNNLFVNIRAPEGKLAGPAVLMWNGSKNTVCENNIFVECQIGIAYGWSEKENDHEGGVIRNNIFYRSAKQKGDVGIAVWNSPGTEVLHNTVFLNGTYGNAIEYRFPAVKDVLIQYNLCDAAIRQRNEARAEIKDNITDAQPDWLTDPEQMDFRLRLTRTTSQRVVNKAKPLKEITADYEGDRRPAGNLSDIGADEITPQQLKRKPKKKKAPGKKEIQIDETPDDQNERPDVPEERPLEREQERPESGNEVEVF